MKDYTQEALEDSRPSAHALEAIDHCLNQLYKDKVCTVTQLVVYGLTFEELIGALLLARDGVEMTTGNVA